MVAVDTVCSNMRIKELGRRSLSCVCAHLVSPVASPSKLPVQLLGIVAVGKQLSEHIVTTSLAMVEHHHPAWTV